jgi:hypothetical protein
VLFWPAFLKVLIVRKYNLPLLALLLLMLTAALYFIFLSPAEQQREEGAPPAEILADGSGSMATKRESLDAAASISRETHAAAAELPSAILVTHIQVVDPNGVGVAGARVLPWVGEEVLEETQTDENGEATFSGLAGAGGYAVMAPHYLAVHGVHHFDGSRIVVHLKDGQVLAGRVTFLRPPVFQELFVMRVFSMYALSGVDIPQAVKDEFWTHKAGVGTSMIPIDREGNFRLLGLPADWIGRMRMPNGYVVYSVEAPATIRDKNFVELPQVSQSLLFRCFELPAFTGRVVTPDGSSGVPGVRVVVNAYLTAEKNNTTSLMGESQADGTFYLPIFAGNTTISKQWCEHPDSITLYAVDISLSGSKDWADNATPIDLVDKNDPWQLGDLPMKERSDFLFRAIDEQGKPIAGAFARTFTLSEATDAEGNGQVALSEDTLEVWVGAKGFLSVRKDATYKIGKVVDFVLPKAARLFVSWSIPEGMDMSTATFRIYTAEGSIFAIHNRAFDSFRRAEGLHLIGGRGPNSSGQMSRYWQLKHDQRDFEIWGLAPGVAMEIRIADLLGTALASSMVTLAAGEERSLELVIDEAPKDFFGRVLDVNGTPLPGVQISIDNQDGYGWGQSTSKDGDFRFQGVVRQIIDLDFTKDGYVKYSMPNFQIPASGDAGVLTLDPAREVGIFFQDKSGRYYENGYVRTPGEYVRNASVENGGIQIASLPQAEFSFEWQLGGAKGTALVPADVEEYVVAVPEMASVAVHATRADAAERDYVNVTFVPVGAAREGIETYDYERSISFEAGENTVDAEFPVLMPGLYRVEFSLTQTKDGKRVTRSLGQQGPVEVLAGQVLTLNLNF